MQYELRSSFRKGVRMPLVTLKTGATVLGVTLRFLLPVLKRLKRKDPKTHRYLVGRCRDSQVNDNCREEKVLRKLNFVSLNCGPKDNSIVASVRDIVLAAEQYGGFDDILLQ
ncbi:MAG: hypothetical protein G01um1014107_176 [Parcubacteria group bacterium Gr01-1014_107]|nr:MAG: hypothetical protein G01um1014107_176 [Parcubacteria group bacterium Gr01-1014_107]